MRELNRVLKYNGIISIIKHNRSGRIMQKVVFENNLDEAINLLNGGTLNAYNFGTISYYDIAEITSPFNLSIEKTMGIRTFYGLPQNNEIKFDTSWQNSMFDIEMKVKDIEEYRNISFFNHYILRKN